MPEIHFFPPPRQQSHQHNLINTGRRASGTKSNSKEILLAGKLEEIGRTERERANLSLSAVKITLLSSSRELNTRRSSRRLKQENRHSKSTCSRRESVGRQSSITCTFNTVYHKYHLKLRLIGMFHHFFDKLCTSVR